MQRSCPGMLPSIRQLLRHIVLGFGLPLWFMTFMDNLIDETDHCSSGQLHGTKNRVLGWAWVLPSPSVVVSWDSQSTHTILLQIPSRMLSHTMLYHTKSFLSLSDYDSNLKSNSLFHETLATPPPSPRITPLSSIDSSSRKSVYSRSTHKLPINQFQPTASSVCHTSPLSPNQKLLSPWARFLQAKLRPDLYHAVLKRTGCQGIEGNNEVDVVEISVNGPRLVFFPLLIWRLHPGLTCA